MSTRAVEMPIDAAMRRFCVTARICRPNGVARRTSCSPMKTTAESTMIQSRLVVIDRPAELERARHEGRVADLAVVGAEQAADQLAAG